MTYKKKRKAELLSSTAPARRSSPTQTESARREQEPATYRDVGRKPGKDELAELNAKRARRHHLDRRAHALADVDGDDDDMLSTPEVALWLQCSVQFLEIGRCKGYGPSFVKIAPKLVRYRRGDVLAWLRERTHASTSAYRAEVA